MIPRELLRPLRAALPDSDIDAATAIGQGWNAAAYRIPDPGGDWVVRIPTAPHHGGEIERQSCLYQALASTGLAVPIEPRYVTDEAGTVLFGLYRYIAGTESSRGRNIGARRSLLAAALSRFLSELHQYPTEQASNCGIAPRDKWGRYVEWMGRHREHFGPSGRGWLDDRLQEFTKAAGDGALPSTLVHADLTSEHLILDDSGGLAGVIDFSGPQIADPAIDFATLGASLGFAFARQVLATYERADERLLARARLYAAVLPLHAVDAGVVRDDPALLRHGLRQIAARAAAATRRATRAP